MRAIAFLFLLAFLAAVGMFAYQNQRDITLEFLNWHIETNVALVIGVIYVLGMFTGWTIIGALRRSFRRATVESERERYAYR